MKLRGVSEVRIIAHMWYLADCWDELSFIVETSMSVC
jgi:hypothetical protein